MDLDQLVPVNPSNDFVRVPTDEYLSLQKEVESLRGQVAEWKRSVEAIALGSKEVEVPLKLALQKCKVALDMADDALLFGPAVNPIQEALEAIKECGL